MTFVWFIVQIVIQLQSTHQWEETADQTGTEVQLLFIQRNVYFFSLHKKMSKLHKAW